MDKATYIELLKKPELLLSMDKEAIDKATIEYPYFNSLQVLAAKKAKLEDAVNQTDVLFQAALATSSRKQLHQFMEQKLVLEETPQKKEDSDEISQDLIESLKNKPQKDFELPEVEYESTPEELGEQVLDIPEVPETKNESESHSFIGWLSKVKTGEKIEEETDAEEEREGLEEVDELIQAHAYEAQLIKTASQIKDINEEKVARKKETPKEKEFDMDELAKKSASLQQGNITETLAGIFELQKKYVKAIEAYEFLSLKYPEKSSFFAGKIKNLKNKL